MIPLCISGAFIAGVMWIARLTAPISQRKWHDEREFEKFRREREEWSRLTIYWNLNR